MADRPTTKAPTTVVDPALDGTCHDVSRMIFMKSVSIRELHERTGRIVRQAAQQPVIVTDRGSRIALLKPYSEEEIVGRPFPIRDPASMPNVDVDSTELISRDRSQR